MNLSNVFQTWLNVLTHPNDETFVQEAEKPDANLTTALIWIVIAGVVTAILSFIAGSLAMGAQGPLFQQIIDQMDLPPEASAQMNAMLSGGLMAGMMGAVSLMSIFTTPIFFLIGVGVLYLIARMLGGTGDFGKYAYLIAVFQAPLIMVQALLGLVPLLGGCIGLVATIYGFVLTYFATKVGHNLTAGKAMAVVLIPVGVLLALFSCIILAAMGIVMSTMGQ